MNALGHTDFISIIIVNKSLAHALIAGKQKSAVSITRLALILYHGLVCVVGGVTSTTAWRAGVNRRFRQFS